MQRSRRRKLLREARRDPFLLQAKRGRDHLRRTSYGGFNRATRRSLAAGAMTALTETQLEQVQEQWAQIKEATR